MNKGRVFLFFTFIFASLCAFAQPDPTPSPALSPSPPPVSAPQPNAVTQSPAPTMSFEEAYKAGIQFYQAKDYEKARDAFAKAAEKDPRNASALTNLALAQFKLNQKGWAIALLRKTLELNPEQPTAKAALKFALSQLEVKEIPHQIETYETLRADFLQPVTLNIYLLITALFLFSAGWTLLSYVGKRKRALLEEESLPAFPLIGALLSLGFFVFFALSTLKFYDSTLTRGTIVEDKVAVQAAPGINQVTLFDLHSGFEVVVRNMDKDWVQVTYPGASTGWIPKSALLITSGRAL